MKMDKYGRQDIAEVTHKQHVIPAYIIEKWKKDGKFYVKDKNDNYFNPLPIKSQDGRFCFNSGQRRGWNEYCEQKGKKIEDNFNDRIDDYVRKVNNVYQISVEQTDVIEAINEYFMLLDFRYNAEKNGYMSNNLTFNELMKYPGIALLDNSCFGDKRILIIPKSIDDKKRIFQEKCHAGEYHKPRKKHLDGNLQQRADLVKQISDNIPSVYQNADETYNVDISEIALDQRLKSLKNNEYNDRLPEQLNNTKWIVVNHDRVILPDSWNHKPVISYSPYQTIMAWVFYAQLLLLAKTYYASNSFIANRLNCIAKLSYRNWYVE